MAEVKEKGKDRTKAPKVFIDPTQLPQELRDFLVVGRVRTADDVSDFATLIVAAMLAGKIPPFWSKILKEWGELMFSSVASKGGARGKPGFDLSALIQADSVTISMPAPAPEPQFPVLRERVPPPLGHTEILDLDFTEVDQEDVRVGERDPFEQFKQKS